MLKTIMIGRRVSSMVKPRPSSSKQSLRLSLFPPFPTRTTTVASSSSSSSDNQTNNQHQELPTSPSSVSCSSSPSSSSSSVALFSVSPMLWLTAAAATTSALLPLPAQAGYEFGGSMNSYYVTLGLFLMTIPGLWSLIKRAPKSKIKRKTYSVPGPSATGARTLDEWAKDIAIYFRKYNYRIVGTGEVITFEGTYQASTSQAFALSFYTLFSLGATALVLSIIFPDGGNWWYLLTLPSPAAGWYYWTNGTRNEQMKVKMMTEDDDATTDIVIEGDEEEIDRFRTELKLLEKGKVYVKGLLEN